MIRQTVSLPAAPQSLFAMYLDADAHAAITGFPVTIAAEAGAEFRAFDGQLSGKILACAEPRLIVQSWRSTKFREDDLDSTLILAFSPDQVEDGGVIDLVHLDVPDHDYDDVVDGWNKYYWQPWLDYLKRSGERR
jgi:activator of HSP90 ATPase